MANSILTPTAVTRKALQILHQKLRFVKSINRQYDDKFAVEGAKIGSTLRVRLPNQYVVRSGATLSTQDTVESYVPVTVSTQKGVDLNFTSVDLTLSLDDFAERILDPAMAILAANIEGDVLPGSINTVYNFVDGSTNAFGFSYAAQGKMMLDYNLTPEDGKRNLLLSPYHSYKYLVDTKGLFTPNGKLGAQYSDGEVKDALGFDVYQTTQMTPQTSGTAANSTGYTVSGGSQTGATITVTGGTTTFLVGDVVTFAGCYAVHPETKVAYNYLQPFVITANSGTSATSLAISPAIVTSGATQNVSASPTNSGAVVKLGPGASGQFIQSMCYHRDAFTFATADLVMPKGVDFAAREVFDGISMRIVRAYDIVNDKFPCRLDVLYGYASLRPQLAARIHASG